MIFALAIVALAAAGGGTWYALSGAGKAKAVEQTVNAPAVVQAVPAPVPTVAAASAPRATAQAVGRGISPSDAQTSNARREADRKLGNGEFAEAEKKAARAAALEMIKTAVAKNGTGRPCRRRQGTHAGPGPRCH